MFCQTSHAEGVVVDYDRSGLPGGGGELEYLNACLFTLVLPRDVVQVQLHVQVPFPSASLVAEDLRARGHLTSILRFFSLLELSSDWLKEDVEELGSRLVSGVLTSAAWVFASILKEAVSLFFASRLACRQAVVVHSLESAWALALRFLSPFCLLLFAESTMVHFLQTASSSCWPMLVLLVFRGRRGGPGQKGMPGLEVPLVVVSQWCQIRGPTPPAMLSISGWLRASVGFL